MRKFGKKNIVKVSPFAYNLALFAESGSGKTSTFIEMAEKNVGEDGYILLNIGLEDGVDAIQGAVYENVKTWADFDAIVNDICKNKNTDYKDLRVVAIDTLDELELLGRKEVIRLHNIDYPSKRIKEFNKAYGGFNNCHDKLSEIILERIAKLKDVGVATFIIGPVKRRTMMDAVSNTEYDIITAKVSNNLFNSIKTKLHVLGLGHVKRNVDKVEIGEDIMGKKKYANQTTEERRVITFRDDNFTIDSKSRFAEIIPEIPFNADSFYNAVTEAIQKAFDKKDIGTTMAQAEKSQAEELQAKTDVNVQIAQEELTPTKMTSEIIEFYKSAEPTDKTMIGNKIKEFGLAKLSDLSTLDFDAIKVVYDLIK